MRKRAMILAAVAVAIVLGVRLSMRGTPAPVEQPPSADSPQPLPARDPSSPPRSGERDRSDDVEAVASRAPPAIEVESTAAPSRSQHFTFRCANDQWFGVRFNYGKAHVFARAELGVGTSTSAQAGVGSGAPYHARDAAFSFDGGVATLAFPGEVDAACVRDESWSREAEARRRGATFLAFGNGPPWFLEITPEFLVVSDGWSRIDFPYRAPTVTGTRRTYHTFAGTQELILVIDRAVCNDSVSGRLLENSVSITTEGMTVYGCGRDIAPR